MLHKFQKQKGLKQFGDKVKEEVGKKPCVYLGATHQLGQEVIWDLWVPIFTPVTWKGWHSLNIFRAPFKPHTLQNSVSLVYFFFFNWSTVDLQCYVSFRCTAKWIAYTYTYIRSFLDSFPILVTTEYWVEFPVVYSRFLSVVYFINSSVYMSIPISQFIPPPFSPLVTIRLLSISVTLFLFCK